MKVLHVLPFLIFFLTSFQYLTAQNVGIGTSNPDASAALEIKDTNRGLLIPRGETTDVISPVAGLLFYQNSDNGFYYYNGSDWVLIGALDAKIEDGDGDTYVTLDDGTDNDVIEFVQDNNAEMAISSRGVKIGDIDNIDYGFNLSVVSDRGNAIAALAYGDFSVGGFFSGEGENSTGLAASALGENSIAARFYADGINSTTLEVENNSIGSNSIAGEFLTNSATNLGIFVENSAADGAGIGGRFSSKSSDGIAASFEASGVNGVAGYFKTEGDNSSTLRAENFSIAPNTVAGSFWSQAPNGYGINVLNGSPMGPGIAGFFSGVSNSGKTLVANSSGVNSIAGSLVSTGLNGSGLFANAQGANGVGIEATATGDSGAAIKIEMDNNNGTGMGIETGPSTRYASLVYHEGAQTAVQINSINSSALYARSDTGTTATVFNLGGDDGIGINAYSQGTGLKVTGDKEAANFIGDVLLFGDQTMTNVSGGNVKLNLFESGDFGYQFDYNGASDKLFLWSKQFAGNEGIRMTWLKNGNVGIGTTAPVAKLHVNGSVLAACGTLSCSDIRYKRNIKKIENAMEGINQINAVYYDWKSEEFAEMGFTDDRQIGIIAQEVEKVYPELVHTNEEGFKTVYYEKLTPILLAGVKEQQMQLASQQIAIKALQKEMLELKKLLQK
jgi:hypothetical protein